MWWHNENQMEARPIPCKRQTTQRLARLPSSNTAHTNEQLVQWNVQNSEKNWNLIHWINYITTSGIFLAHFELFRQIVVICRAGQLSFCLFSIADAFATIPVLPYPSSPSLSVLLQNVGWWWVLQGSRVESIHTAACALLLQEAPPRYQDGRMKYSYESNPSAKLVS